MTLDRVLVHYRPQERIFVQRIVEMAERAQEWHSPILTDFLDPRQTIIADQIARTVGDVRIFPHGGWEDAERRRGIFAPAYFNPASDDFALCALRIEAPVPYVRLRHSDYLGAVLGLGLKRTKMGDLVVHDVGCDGVFTPEIAEYVQGHLTSVGRATVRVSRLDLADLAPRQETYSERSITVMSMRLDAVVSHGLNISRSSAQQAIQSGKVQMNWVVTEDSSEEVAEGDVISVRGVGRMRILSLEGLSRKGRAVVTIRRYT